MNRHVNIVYAGCLIPDPKPVTTHRLWNVNHCLRRTARFHGGREPFLQDLPCVASAAGVKLTHGGLMCPWRSPADFCSGIEQTQFFSRHAKSHGLHTLGQFPFFSHTSCQLGGLRKRECHSCSEAGTVRGEGAVLRSRCASLQGIWSFRFSGLLPSEELQIPPQAPMQHLRCQEHWDRARLARRLQMLSSFKRAGKTALRNSPKHLW